MTIGLLDGSVGLQFDLVLHRMWESCKLDMGIFMRRFFQFIFEQYTWIFFDEQLFLHQSSHRVHKIRQLHRPCTVLWR